MASPALAQIKQIATAHFQDWDDGGVTFRGQPVSVVINHSPTVKWADGSGPKQNVEFLPKDYSTVRIMRDAYDVQPKVGEVFTDAQGGTHRIQEIQGFKLSLLCLCKQGNVAS